MLYIQGDSKLNLKILRKVEKTKTERNHTGMHDQKPQTDQLEINEDAEMKSQ